MALVIREMDPTSDRRGVAAIDTSFETSVIFDVQIAPRRIELVERPLATARVKRYPVEYEAWHARLVLWHLYVSPQLRRSGVGRALLERAEAHGRSLGAHHVWLE